MSERYDKLVPALKSLLPPDRLDVLGRSVRFIQRLRAVRASLFVWSVVLSRFGSGTPGFEQARRWYRKIAGILLEPRPFQKRFKAPAAVRLFERAFASAVEPWLVRPRPRHPLARRFADVVVVDSTLMQLNDSLRDAFKGARAAASSIKTLLTVSVFGLVPLHAQLVEGNAHDMTLFPPLELFRKGDGGTLLLFDKGFVAYERLRTIAEAHLHYLCPMRLNGNALILAVHRAPKYVRVALRRHPEGVWLRELLPAGKKIRKAWDVEVVLWPKTEARSKQQVSTRLVLVPGPKGAQRPYLTTLDAKEWMPAALAEMYRLRWQVELVFKELKQFLNLESLPSKDRHAVQVFAWASLIALALSRTVATCFCPLKQLVGLAALLRPALVTRALRANIRLLAHAILATQARKKDLLLRTFFEEIVDEVQARDRERSDSYSRVIPLLRTA